MAAPTLVPTRHQPEPNPGCRHPFAVVTANPYRHQIIPRDLPADFEIAAERFGRAMALTEMIQAAPKRGFSGFVFKIKNRRKNHILFKYSILTNINNGFVWQTPHLPLLPVLAAPGPGFTHVIRAVRWLWTLDFGLSPPSRLVPAFPCQRPPVRRPVGRAARSLRRPVGCILTVQPLPVKLFWRRVGRSRIPSATLYFIGSNSPFPGENV